MGTISYDKLVRDKIPEIIQASGKEAACRIASSEEAEWYLRQKLCEEAEEYRQSGDAEELADVLEVVYAIAAEKGVSREALEEARMKKARERGGFSQRIVLMAVQERK